MVEVALTEAMGAPLQAWKVTDGQLQVRLVGTPDLRTVRCKCGRRHWIVETLLRGRRSHLSVRCHGCGQTGEFALEGLDTTEG